ncbi:MAG: type IV toxin-antitoxin system AbiEi family antitoxin domain-containing protein [Candidatus Woesearchaeota archaeon]
MKTKNQRFQEIKKVFKENNGYVHTQDIIEAGIHTSYLYQMGKRGIINKIKRGLYHWQDNNFMPEDELIQVSKIVPKGVFCLLSSLSYYEITTVEAWEYYIAIERTQHRPKVPDYPPINFFYFSEKSYETGIKKVNINGEEVKMYDLEKTICDCIRYRNKIGQDIVKEALNDYVNLQEKDIGKLLEYAKITGIPNLMNKYLEVLV